MALVFPSTPTPGQTYVGPNNITYTWDNTLGVWTGSSPAAGGLTAASLAQAAAGTLNTVASTPQTAVPKDASGMTGAALLPSGTNAQRPGTPTSGMFRWNTNPASLIGNRLEVYDTAYPAWRPLEYATTPPTTTTFTATNNQVLSGSILCDDFIVPAGVQIFISGSLYVYATGDVTIEGVVNGNFLGTSGAAGYGAGVVSGTNLYVGPGFGLGGGSAVSGGRTYSPELSLAGSGGSGAFCSSGGAALVQGGTGTGGASGASFLVRAQGTITIAAGAAMGLDGGPGYIYDRASAMIVSGPGGGSGGVVILHANGNVTNSGVINCQGGAGDGPHNGGCGGGGGGGGIVILQSDFGTSTLGTISVAGGPGAGGATLSLGGGGGGGCGGAGGDGGTSTLSGIAGSTGIISTFGSPL